MALLFVCLFVCVSKLWFGLLGFGFDLGFGFGFDFYVDFDFGFYFSFGFNSRVVSRNIFLSC